MKNIFLLLIFLTNTPLFGQNKITLEDAIETALSQNRNIQIFRKSAEVLKNNVSKGNAGLLPSVTANASASYSNNSTKLQFAGGNPDISQNGASTVVYNANVTVTYILYNGGVNKKNYQRLQILAEQGNINAKQNIELIILQTVNAYYAVVRQSANYELAKEAVKISLDRLQRAETKNEFGGNKLDVLNAKVDLNTDSLSLINLEMTLDSSKRNLNYFLAKEVSDTNYEVDTAVTFNENIDLQNLLQTAKTKNIALENANYQKTLSNLEVSLAEARQMPTLSTNISYGYNRSENDAGFVLVNRNLGLTTSLNLSFNIFNGQQQKLAIQNAKINQDVDNLQYTELEKRLERDLTNAYANYQNTLRSLKMEAKNVKFVEENFERSKETFEAGLINTTQFREAQLNLLNSKNRLINAQFSTKLTEIALIRLAGLLLEDE